MDLFGGKSRIKIFLGEYGSGKTEISLNYALAMKDQNSNIAVVDFDLVKPYYRTREQKDKLEQNNIKVIAPDQKFSSADLPIMPQNLIRILYDEQYQVIIDVGGSEAAVVLGQIKQHLDIVGYEAFLVINTLRPFSSNQMDIIENLRLIEQASRLKVSGLISNTNLAANTTVENILNGLEMVNKVSIEVDVPVSCVVIPEWLKDQFNIKKTSVFLLKPLTQYPWMDA